MPIAIAGAILFAAGHALLLVPRRPRLFNSAVRVLVASGTCLLIVGTWLQF